MTETWEQSQSQMNARKKTTQGSRGFIKMRTKISRSLTKMDDTVTYSFGLLIFRHSLVRTIGELCVWPKLGDNVMAEPEK